MRKPSAVISLLAGAMLVMPAMARAQDLVVGLPTSPPNVVHMAVLIADDLGLYKKHGISVKTISQAGGVFVYRAMLAGNVDVGMVPGSIVIIGASKGSPARMIYVNAPKFEASMVARPNVPTMADLKGKRIGIQEPGGFADINSRAVLRAAKIDPKDVSFVSIATEDVPALVADQVDTGILHVEQETFAKSKVPGIHAIARMWELQPKTLYLGAAATDKTIKEKPAQLKAFIKANIEATRLLYSDRAKVMPSLVKHTGYPQKILEESLDFMVKECIWDANTGLGPERFEFTANLMTKVGNISEGKTPKPEDVIHASFAREAIAELGEWKGPVCPSPAF
jgi:NitT/TauT family transport system substrate-binding protein